MRSVLFSMPDLRTLIIPLLDIIMTVGRPRDNSASSTRAGIGLQKSDMSIDIVIIGASVAGLACAYSLRQAGHTVLVLESESELGKSPGGVRIPPNMSRILLQWGLRPDIEELTSGRCPKIVFHSGYTGERIGELLFHEKVMEALEAEVYFLHHSDLLLMLYKLASGAGAQFIFGCRVKDIDLETPSVTLPSGEKLRADLVIGADGRQSIIRSILQRDDKEDDETNYTSYLFTVPTALFEDDDDLLQLIKEPLWNIWMGSGWAVLGHAVRKNTEFAVSLFINEKGADAQTNWRQKVPITDLDIDQFEFAPVVDRIVRLTDDAVRIRDTRTTSLEHWYDSNGHIVVIGEAAHKLNPGSTHAAALAVEDAVVLGRLLSKLKSKDEIKRFLSSFQEIRQSRCEDVRISEQQKVDFVVMPPGPLRDIRDQSMRLQMEQGKLDWTTSSEIYLRKSWEEFRDLFGYDAFDDADTWWVEWGVLFERMNITNGVANNDIFDGQVVVEQARHTVSLV